MYFLATTDGSETTAKSASTVNAYIDGNVIIVTTGDVNVGAELEGTVTSRAQAPDTVVTAASLGVVKVYAVFKDDKVSAYIAQQCRGDRGCS